jgi:predicted transcriptional regulator
MASKKVTISLPEEDLERIGDLARAAGLPLSTWIGQVLAQRARAAERLAAVEAWEAEHGPITAQEQAVVAAELARAQADMLGDARRTV